MAAKILANLIVMGSGIMARAFVQAYRQALARHVAPSAGTRSMIHRKRFSLEISVHVQKFLLQEVDSLMLCLDASKSGVAQETIQNTVRRGKTMVEQEARQILGVSEQATWEDILQKYDTLFERNAKNGSFYLQSKVHRAKECLESVYQGKGQEGTAG
ncbi:hypothetical protein L1049_010775 [Liquidambar formosana]|uniref:Mitochondrial import inner membrane translocase subunit Tim16 n=1 Tax=Liquidambar formosana TaxID=63359 RepID=A0AAP0R1S4_LIQFO